ncbi:hypothetical protein FJZ53_02555 [Candidatus Woesearchaeota archaeon]|nr:hypothetical protein [Candidatus Woesearchaeota archaeon]
MERDYKKTLDDQLKDLKGEVGRQTDEYKSENGNLTDKLMQYVRGTGIKEKAIKVGAATTLAFIVGVAAPIVTGPTLAVPVLVVYGGKKFIYDPLFKKKRK